MKSVIFTFAPAGIGSLLSWERGLKFQFAAHSQNQIEVAPLVGAWIEIGYKISRYAIIRSLLSWERGLKLNDMTPDERNLLRRSSRGSVD